MNGAREDPLAFWNAFAAEHTSENDAETAGLALCGGADPIYDAYRDRAERLAIAGLFPIIDTSWRVLDLGCGPGRWLIPMATCCTKVVGVDCSAQMLEHARRRCARAGVDANVRLRKVRLEELDARKLGGPFDLVLAMGVLQYFPEASLPELMRKIAECVAPNGLLLHRETRAPRAWERCHANASGELAVRSYYKPFETYRAAFEREGFSVLDRRSVIPPSIAYAMYSRLFAQRGPRWILRALLAAHERAIDPLWRLFPGLLWRVNARRLTDQAAVLYRKSNVQGARGTVAL